MLSKTKRNIHPIKGVWQEENNLWLLRQFYKINVILLYEQWRVSLSLSLNFL